MTWCTLCMLVALTVLTACSSHADETPAATVLRIYVYAPEHPLSTRASGGSVTASYEERRINTLQIWVFKSGTDQLVGYLDPNATDREALNSSGGTTLQMVIDQSFGLSPQPVDVYVLANVRPDNSGLAFDASATRTQLEAALMGQTGATGGHADPFGLTTLTTAVPADGLPMSGVLRNQPVTGEAPILRVGTSSELATVRLVRMVSKVRFVFSRSADSEETLDILGVTLDGDQIPQDEYVFLTGPYDERSSHVGPTYVSDSRPLLDSPIADAAIGKPEDPGLYTYLGGDAQDYEVQVTKGIAAGELTLRGPYYLRETDRKLTGAISYVLNGGAAKTATFSVADAGDFSRNHTWLVYAHYGTSVLEVVSVEVMDWKQRTSEPRVIYNW